MCVAVFQYDVMNQRFTFFFFFLTWGFWLSALSLCLSLSLWLCQSTSYKTAIHLLLGRASVTVATVARSPVSLFSRDFSRGSKEQDWSCDALRPMIWCHVSCPASSSEILWLNNNNNDIKKDIQKFYYLVLSSLVKILFLYILMRNAFFHNWVALLCFLTKQND